MKKNIKARNVALLALLFASGAVSAATVNLNGIGYVQYGDGMSYSMPLSNWYVTGDATPVSGDPFYIASSPGQIANLVVPATGAGGPGAPVVNNPTGMDDAYATPSGVAGENFFQTGGLTFSGITYPAPDPGGSGEFANDYGNTWDATLTSLKTFLAGDQMVFFFNNNQLNQTQAQQSLAFWGQLWITDGAGNVVDPDGAAGPQTGYYEFTNHMGLYALVTEGGGGVILGDPTTFTSAGRTSPGGDASTNMTDYVLSGGELCVATATGVLVACEGKDLTSGDYLKVNHNLGANNAAYAVVFPELNALMDALFANTSMDLTQFTLHGDFRMGCDPTLFGTDPNALICDGENADGTGWGKNLNNGYEQVFIGTLARPPHENPEPASLALMGSALLGFAAMRRRKA